MLAALVDSVPASRVLLLVTYRPGYQPPWLGKSYASQLALGRLTGDESQAVLRVGPSRRAPLRRPRAQRIIARAEGVPLFIEELARAVVEGAADTPDSPVPDTIEGVLAARLDRLAAGDRGLLQVASVIGQGRQRADSRGREPPAGGRAAHRPGPPPRSASSSTRSRRPSGRW